MTALQMTQWKRQKKLRPCCRQPSLEDDHFATCGLPMTSFCSEGVNKSCNNSKTGGNSGWIRCGNQLREEQNSHQPHQYLGSTQIKDGTSVKEVKIRLAQGHSATIRLLKNKVISFPANIILYRSLVMSVLLYGCESWTLAADLERWIQAFENKCYIRMFGISYREHKTNDYVWQQISILTDLKSFCSQASQVIMVRPWLDDFDQPVVNVVLF